MGKAKEQRVGPEVLKVTLQPQGSSGQISDLQSFSRATQDNAQLPQANGLVHPLPMPASFSSPHTPSNTH